MRLSDRFDLLQTLPDNPASLREAPGLALHEIRPEGLGAAGHKTALTPPLPYLFEERSSVHSPWIVPAEAFGSFIGAHSYVNGGGYLRGRVLIGRYASVGRRVTIGAGMHRMDGLSTSPALSHAPRDARREGTERPAVTVIESDVWIGDGAVILPGLRLGVGAVIGANAVVTRDVVPFGIYGGVPARLIRRRFGDDTCEALLAARWWDLPHERLRRMPAHDVPALLAGLQADPGEPADLPIYACLADGEGTPS